MITPPFLLARKYLNFKLFYKFSSNNYANPNNFLKAMRKQLVITS